jgi:hypothetical protein
MELSVRKDDRYWVSELTMEGKTVRTIHSPPSIFYRKRDATEFNAFVSNLIGTRQGKDITDKEKQEIRNKLKEYDKPYNMA